MSTYILYGFLTMLTFDILLVPQSVIMGVLPRFLVIILWPFMLILLIRQFFKNDNY
jgi:hypothetical protein